ncbi:MAG TPA: tripartite tricarboxylate transporter substrate-binding protein [Marinobacterium sp.]|nr:tripartite tricarboxylate transporter substrate-binding protein [Marinobacterium sp.]
MKLSKLKLMVAGATLSLAASSSFAAECIAPANPGGGWDFTCRQIGKIMHDIGVVADPIQVTNMAGAGGGLAYAHVVNERNNDEDVIVAASTATATRLAQNAYSGMTSDQVRFLGAIGADPGVIVVAKDSPYQTLNELLDAVIADPSKHAFAGGSAAGGYDHLKVLMALKRKGFTDIRKVKYIAVDGDADAITQTIGGFTSAMTGDISGVVSFIKNGDVRVLASFTDERIEIPGLGVEIPTAKEQGIDVVAVNWRGLYTPKGASEASYNKWSDALAQVAASKEWADAMEANGLVKFTKVGPDFQSYLNGVMQEVQDMSKELGVLK